MTVFVSSVEGNRQKLDGGAMFGNAPRPVWETWLRPDALGRIDLACRSLLIEIGDIKILCETGVGGYFSPKLAERFGIQNAKKHVLVENLLARGISHEDIDFVILSHLHFDHAGGLFPCYEERKYGSDQLLFPNATYMVGPDAMARSREPHQRDRASFLSELPGLLDDSRRLLMIDNDALPEEFQGRIRFLRSDGHTPGQMHTLVKGDKDTMLFCGDMVPGRSWLHIPITMGYDRFPELLIDEKRTHLTKAAEQNWLLFFTHDPDKAASRCRFTDRGRLVAESESDSLDRYEL